jgi:hypothetical protein
MNKLGVRTTCKSFHDEKLFGLQVKTHLVNAYQVGEKTKHGFLKSFDHFFGLFDFVLSLDYVFEGCNQVLCIVSKLTFLDNFMNCFAQTQIAEQFGRG